VLRGVSGIVLAAAAAAVALPARAQDAAQPEPLGIDLGLQVGVGLPYGRINESIPLVLNDVISSMVPIAADAGYRVDDLIAVGLRLQYGILQFRDAGEVCGRGSDCRGSAIAVAAHGTIRAPVPWPVIPWLRLGAGYEWLRMRLTGDFMGAPADLSLRFRGWMFGFAEVGGDYALLPQLAVGPFVGVSVGRYNFGADGSGPEGPLIYKRVHEWVVLGVRGVFSL
jgi:hypothetical protein